MSSPLGFTPRLVNPDGTRNIFCRACGRVIARVAGPMAGTVTQCALCQGYPEENVLPQAVQLDPTRPPVPIAPEEAIFLYPEEEVEAKKNKPWSGMLRPLFRALGLLPEQVEPEPTQVVIEELESKKVAKRKKSGGLFEG